MEPVIIQTRDVAFTIYMINIQCTSIIYVLYTTKLLLLNLKTGDSRRIIYALNEIDAVT
jgi:hypothetical protein